VAAIHVRMVPSPFFLDQTRGMPAPVPHEPPPFRRRRRRSPASDLRGSEPNRWPDRFR
jgi:hypothetical protein